MRRVLHLAIVAALLLTCAVAVGADSGGSAAAKARCRGVIATIVGTGGADRLVGTQRADVIVAKGGNDVIRARGGNDKVCDGAGRDRISLAAGNDDARGGGGADRIDGGGGNDLLAGEGGNDRIDGGAGRDRIDGGSGTDDCRGGPGRNTIRRCEGGGPSTPPTPPTPADQPPLAVADTRTVTEDDPQQTIDVLANDTDPDGGPKSIGSTTQPPSGTVSITGGGSGLTYRPDANYCNSGGSTDNFSYTLAPGASSAQVAVTVGCVNDKPAVTTTAGARSYPEGSGPRTIDSGLTVADVDSGTLSGATIQITANYGPDQLDFTSMFGIVGSYDGGSGTLEIQGNATVAEYQTVLRSVTFETSAAASSPTRTVAFRVTDLDASSEQTSDPATRDITIGGPNQAPSVVATDPPALEYQENDPPKAVDDGLAVTEPNSHELTDASASITSNFQAGEDALAWSDNDPADNITLDAASSAQTVLLTGSDTAARYQAALRAVTYVNSSDAPTWNLQRTVTFAVTDEFGSPGSDTRAINVNQVEDPAVAEDDSATVSEDAPATDVPVLDNDTELDDEPLTINNTSQPTNGTVVLTGGSIGSHTGLTYEPDDNYCNSSPLAPPDTFTYTLNSGDAATVSMTVTCVNDAPIADDETFNGNDSAHGNTTMVVDDPDDDGPNPSRPKTTVSGDILAGDTDLDGPGPLTVTPGTFATNDGGSVTIEADGDFTFEPAASTSCTDTSDFFDYTVEDSGSPEQTDVGRVTIAIAGCVWYVHNNATGNSGTSAAPFDTLAQAETASGANHTVFVFDGDNTTTGYATGYQLNSGERLISEHEGLVVDPDQGGSLTADSLYGANVGARPTLTAIDEDVISLDDGNEVRGFDVDPQGAGGGIAGGAGDTGGGTFVDVSVVDGGTAGTQPGVELDGTSGTFNFSNLAVSTNGAQGIRLNSAGTADFESTTVTTSGAKALHAAGTSMGTSAFDAITATGSGDGGVDLSNTTGTTSFGDGTGTDLALTTTSGVPAAFRLANAGGVTVDAAGADNVSATGGPAIDVTGTSGASLAFDDVDSTNSANDGINLDGLGPGTFSAASGDIGGAAGISFDLNGGSGAITFPGTLANGSGQTARVTGRTGGAVGLSGPLGDTNDTGGGISLNGNSGGSTTFSNATKTFNTGGSSAVTMTSSDGHTLNLTGGSLDIDTTTGNGLEATNSGTITVTGAGNTVDTGTGRPLNVTNTDIGAADLAFQRISSNGAAGGIVLVNTASAGGLTVSGTGAASSGGQILNSTDPNPGVLLNGVSGGVSLDRMNIAGGLDDGIRATNVSGLSVSNSTVSGNGNDTDNNERGFDLVNQSGTLTLTGNTLTANREDGIKVANTTGTLTANITGGTVEDTIKNDGILFDIDGVGSTAITVQNTTFDNNHGDHYQVASDPTLASGGATVNSTITGTTMTGTPVIEVGASGSVGGGVTIGGTGEADITSTVTDNDIAGTEASGIDHFALTGNAEIDATITGNTVNSPGSDGIKLEAAVNGTLRALVTGNSIGPATGHPNAYNFAGIELFSKQTADIDATLRSNTVTGGHPTNSLNGLRAQAGLTGSTDTATLCLAAGDVGLSNASLRNTFTGSSPAAGQTDMRAIQRGNTIFRLPGLSPSPSTNPTDVVNYLQARNTGDASAAVDAGSFQNATCATP